MLLLLLLLSPRPRRRPFTAISFPLSPFPSPAVELQGEQHRRHVRPQPAATATSRPTLPAAPPRAGRRRQQRQPPPHLLRHGEPDAGGGDRLLPRARAGQDQDQAVRGRGAVRAAAGERARERRVPGAAHLPAGEREPHGAAHHGGRLPPRLRQDHHSRRALLRAGAHRVLACDLHSGQSIGYFDIPVDHVYGQPVILDYLASKTICPNDVVVVSPDVGGVARARAFAKKLSDAPLAIVDKRRLGHNQAEVMNLIGDVRGKVAVMVDDMIDTAGTMHKGAELLHREGARAVYACSTHAVLSPPAVERLSGGLFQEVIITNTVPVPPDQRFPQLTVLSVANLLGETIWRVHDECSVSSIFQ
uniref:Ribose-phosphate diphosphokinase n=1 Tax=Aegilops tauschii subsp. strangulata TaxID=200361 RepID=A0A453JBM5_AEGTS